MKLLYVTPGLGGGGGAERSLASLVPHWRDELDLNIVTFSGRNELAARLRDDGARVTNLDGRRRQQVVRQLRALIVQEDPDLVHSVLFDADIAARLATPRHIPLSCSLVNVNYGPEQRMAPGRSMWKVRAAQVADAATAQRVTSFHALSREVASVMTRRLLIPSKRVEVIPRGRDRAELGYPSVERRAEVRGRLGIGNRPLVIAAARHEWQKGLDILIRAFPLLRRSFPDLVLLVGGRQGSETTRLHDLARRVGLDPTTTFLGARDDVPDLMCAADAFCVPSRWEGLGSIMIEAMALGAPVVAADIPPIRELDPDNSWVQFFTSGEANSLASAVTRTLNDPLQATRARIAIGQFDASYRSDRIAKSMYSFFLAAVRSGSTSRA